MKREKKCKNLKEIQPGDDYSGGDDDNVVVGLPLLEVGPRTSC